MTPVDGFLIGAAALLVYAALMPLILRMPGRTAPIVRLGAAAILVHAASIASALIFLHPSSYWLIAAPFWFGVNAYVFAFSAVYKSVSLKVLTKLNRSANGRISVDEITAELIKPSFSERMRLLVSSDLVAHSRDQYSLTPKGERMARRIGFVQSIFGIAHSGLYTPVSEEVVPTTESTQCPGKKQLTIVVPAFNEERKLEITVREIIEEAASVLDEFEVIIVNDGSKDGTGPIADRLARDNAMVQVQHQPFNQGVGAAFYVGLHLARFPYLSLVPGDHPFHRSGIRRVFEAVGTTELVVSYRANPRARTPLRRVLSRCCTRAMRLLTSCPIRDAHSMYVFPVALARRVRQNKGYGYHIETLSTLLRSVPSYTEVPVTLTPKPDASSGVMRWSTLLGLMWTMARMYALRFSIGLGLRLDASIAKQPFTNWTRTSQHNQRCA